ncbi:hypothetical protein H0H93_013046 [Arthromyces matolae]|nr:hypothetical protein H0H93_013046 [Arthromyces matolae]
MRIVVFGATGAIGILTVRRALEVLESCELLLYVRSIEKVPDDIKSHPSVTVVHGQLTDHASLFETLKGADLVLSSLGPSVLKLPFHPWNTPLANAYRSIIDIMHQHGIKRLICLGTPSMTDPDDKFNLAYSIMVTAVATVGRPAYNDIVEIGKTVRTHGADLDWTILRVPALTNRSSTDVVLGYIGDGRTNIHLARAGYAAFVVDEIEKKEWIKKAPLITSA